MLLQNFYNTLCLHLTQYSTKCGCMDVILSFNAFFERGKKILYTFLHVFPDIWSFFYIKKCQMPPKRYNDITLAVPTIVPLHCQCKNV